jgi:hypothetical protein
MITPPYQITKHKEYRKEVSFHIMKKYSIRISVLSIAFSVMFLVVSSGTKAGTQDGPKKDLVSELHLESASLLGPKSYSVDGKDLKSNPLRGFLIPLKKGLNAFIDCASPLHQDGLTPKDTRTNYRAVIGFHFSLR